MCWSLSSVAWNFPKRPTHSRQSFCINAPVFLFQFWEETSLTGFLKFRLSALPNKFGKIKIFPAQSINIHYKQPPGSLKCVRYAATRKAISPLWKLIWSTSAYRCWHSQASTYPAGWSEFLFCLFFFPPHFKAWQHTRISTNFYLCQAITCDGNRCRVTGLKKSVALRMTVIHHRATLHRRQSWINLLKLHKHTKCCAPSCCSRRPITSSASPGETETGMGGNIPK